MAETRPPLYEITAPIDGERRDALLSALRRNRTAEAVELLDGWSPAALISLEAEERYADGAPWMGASCSQQRQELGDWLRRECRLHVDTGRFQHALVLIERYAFLPLLLTQAAAEARLERLFR